MPATLNPSLGPLLLCERVAVSHVACCCGLVQVYLVRKGRRLSWFSEGYRCDAYVQLKLAVRNYPGSIDRHNTYIAGGGPDI
jgi:hypothetical protein